MVLYCPICKYTPLEPVAFGNTFIYYCPNCNLYFKQEYGKLSYPLVNPPREYLEKIRRPEEETPLDKLDHTIGKWVKFLSEYGISQREYRKLPNSEKQYIRGLYRKWLRKKTIDKRLESKDEDEYIKSGALQGLKKSQVPIFEKWLNDKLGVGLGEFYDQNPKIQRDLRTSFRQWLREQRITT